MARGLVSNDVLLIAARVMRRLDMSQRHLSGSVHGVQTNRLIRGLAIVESKLEINARCGQYVEAVRRGRVPAGFVYVFVAPSLVFSVFFLFL